MTRDQTSAPPEPGQAAPARDVDEYIAHAPPAARGKLEELRQAVRSEAPEAVERISYGMPSYHLGRARLAYFSAHSRHIGLYPADASDAEAAGLGAHVAAKSTLQFALNQPLPLSAIRRFIKRRVEAAESDTRNRGGDDGDEQDHDGVRNIHGHSNIQ